MRNYAQKSFFSSCELHLRHIEPIYLHHPGISCTNQLAKYDVQPHKNEAEHPVLWASYKETLLFIPHLHPLNLLHKPPSELLGSEDGELAAVAEDGVHEVVGGIAAEGEERGGRKGPGAARRGGAWF